jgi:hypothetical protein
MDVTQLTTLAVLGPRGAADAPIPRVWCQLDSPLRAGLAQCWAKLVHRMRPHGAADPGGKHGRVE